MSRIRPQRQTLKISASSKAPMRIVLFLLPMLAVALMLCFVMPLTGIVSTVIIMIALLTLPLKARKGECPECGHVKMFPFSGFGGACKGCGKDIVLRGEEVHLLEPRSQVPVVGSGRGHQPTRKR
ncbi:MAG: hypothetical protein Q9N67_02330 [Ghiorsea sp.]|nr:hypothetical protein [Ghiorsea sp.]